MSFFDDVQLPTNTSSPSGTTPVIPQLPGGFFSSVKLPTTNPSSVSVPTPSTIPTQPASPLSNLNETISAPNPSVKPMNSLDSWIMQATGSKFLANNFVSKGLGDAVDVVKGAVNDAADKGTAFIQSLDNTNPDNTPLKRLSTGTDALVSAANVAFSPISATFKAAEDIPIAGKIVQGLDWGFGKIGQGASWGAGKIVDSLPISQTAKDTIKGPLQDLSALAAQVIAGKVGSDYALPLAKEKIAEIRNIATKDLTAAHIKGTPYDVNKIIEQVKSKIPETKSEVKPVEKETPADKSTEQTPASSEKPGEIVALARHGETDSNGADKAFRGWEETDKNQLTDKGKQDAKNIGESIKQIIGNDDPSKYVIVSSDLNRATDSAKIASDVSGVPQGKAYPELRSQDTGNFSGVKESEVKDQVKDINENHPDQALPGASESHDDFVKRTKDALKPGGLIEQDNPGKKIIAVVHHQVEVMQANDFAKATDAMFEKGIKPGGLRELVDRTPNKEGGGVNPSEIAKSAKELGQREIKGIKNSGIVKSAKEIAKGISPQTASPEAQQTADFVRKAKAEIENFKALESYKYKAATKFFSKLGDEKNIHNISEYERTGKFPDAPAEYSQFYKDSMDTSHEVLQKVYGENKVGYVENYVRRQFEFGSVADEKKGTSFLTNAMNSLSAEKSNIKARVLDMPLDEALQSMKDRGIDVKPVSTNPELLRQWSVANAKQAAEYADTWNQLKSGGLTTFVKTGDTIPDGMVKLNDKVSQVFFPSESGLVKGGQYYADENVARILNNTISRGLGSSATFRAIRGLNNSINQLQLGLSAFHLIGTAINSGVSDLALGTGKLVKGDISGLKNIGRAFTGVGSFSNDVYNGNQFIKDLRAGNPVADDFLKEKFNPAGARLKIDQTYINRAADKMIESFKKQTISGALGGLLRIPSVVMETVAKPLMEYSIPRAKIGAFMNIANDIASKMPDATDSQLHRAYASAWDSVDNRFGQLTYDNVFWDKTAKDLASVGTRSVGWNMGTLRELGGGISDIATKTAKGEGLSQRSLYTFSLPIYVGIIGAVYQYLHTGQPPTQLKDYFYPKNGQVDKNGNPIRTSMPTYMKDVYSYGTSPIQTVESKASPLLDMTIELAQNKDYYDNIIRTPGDSFGKQLQQTGSYVLSNVEPFSLQQTTNAPGVNQTTEQKAEGYLGFTKARADIISPYDSTINTMQYTEKPQVITAIKKALVAGDNDKAVSLAKDFNDRLREQVKQSLLEKGKTATTDQVNAILQNKTFGQTFGISMPSANSMRNYKSNQGKSALYRNYSN